MRTWISGLCLMAALLLAEIPPGTYKGEWSGATASGEIRFLIRDGAKPEVSFTLSGEDVKCTVKSYRIDGAKFSVVYDFDLQGNALESTAEGTLTGKTLSGSYKTSTAGQDVDSGTWKASAP